MPTRSKPDTGPVTVVGDMNGFERTVRYIAEHSSVLYASVVDSEGLLLANHCRGKIDPEDLAPLAVMFFEWNRSILAKGKLGHAEKIDLTLKDKRLILGRVDAWCLMVLSERQADDLVNIRINQGMEILRKFTAERYASGQQTQVEKAYV
jgi:predicted regulator of Ras-like GTPase activity (Roadblock/LC7/MglB family)